MNKYIDAEKLKTWLGNEADMEFKKTEENANSPVLCHFHNGCRMQALDTIDFIDSLQQEQPEVDIVAKLKHYFATTPKEQLEQKWKELEHWNSIGPTVQEFLYGKQPEVELEKEVEKQIRNTFYDLDGIAIMGTSKYASVEDMEYIARHFYELGQRAMRKRIVDPEYNRDVIEKMKTEYPVDESNARKE